MRTAYCGLAIWLLSSIPSPTQTNVQIKGTTEFKPSDTIPMTVRFAEKLPLDSSVHVTYTLRATERQPGEDCRAGSELIWNGSSSDGLTFELSGGVSDNALSGTYQFANLNVSSPGLQSNSSSNAMNPPLIIVKNNIRCPKTVEIPTFTITVKPKP
jgi:hypothetical protein